jgi:nucleoside-diphosphate-sugar epimerase
MTSIGILGASSQVGASVACWLKKFPDVRVTCFIRSTYSKLFFDLLEIDCQILRDDDPVGFREKIGAMDVVLDFGYPSGQLQEILERSKMTIGNVLANLKKGSMYFYMSSIMAYGMPDGEKWIGHYYIPRTPYAYIKRRLEKFTQGRGKRLGVQIFNFRLGQVHGFLQSVNGSFRKKLSDSNIALVDGNPDDPVNIIFIYPLCEAIIQCIKGLHPPGLYTLVSSPQWTLKELYDYYLRYYRLPAHLEFAPAEVKKKGKTFFQKGVDMVRPYRSILETYVLMRIPGLAVRLKGRFRQGELLRIESSAAGEREYIDFNLLGKPPFKVISGLTADPEKIFQLEKEQEEYYNALIVSKRR